MLVTSELCARLTELADVTRAAWDEDGLPRVGTLATRPRCDELEGASTGSLAVQGDGDGGNTTE